LIAETTVHGHETEHNAIDHSTTEKITSQPEIKASVAASEEITDLTQNVEQCQGTTGKGSRCSRTSHLEPVFISIENKKYKFLSCKQHNTDSFTPFHFR